MQCAAESSMLFTSSDIPRVSVLDKFLTKCSVPYNGDCHFTIFLFYPKALLYFALLLSKQQQMYDRLE